MYKIVQVMIKNPLLIVFPAAAILILAVPYIILQPDLVRLTDIYGGMADMESFLENFELRHMIFVLSATLKTVVISIVCCALMAVFIAGYGNMQSAVVNGGKASLRVFIYGIKMFTGKVILSFLLLFGIIYGISFVFSLIATPVFITLIINEGGLKADFFGKQMVLQIVMIIIMTLLYPLIILWLPATFLDRDKWVAECLKNGLRAGGRKYFQVLPAVIAMMLPTLLLYLLSDNVFTMLKSPYYYLMYPYLMIVFPFVLTFIFLRYDSFRKKRIEAQTV